MSRWNQTKKITVADWFSAAPIWEAPLASRTVPQGEDAVFHCKARSASGENVPEPPKWYKNGERLDISYSKGFHHNVLMLSSTVHPSGEFDGVCFFLSLLAA